ncbi:MAG: Ig-like domain-containing protein [Firmicutes bacterium]|nr:Ig-like domain-containing protein [Bacillota bacterium]
MKKIFAIIVLLLFIGVLASCKPEVEETKMFTVTFQTGENASTVEAQEIENGGKVAKPADPTRDGFVFSGKWMNGTFEWNFALDIVTDDLTLIATWIEISSTPSEIAMDDEVFTSTVTWMQTDADLQSFTVSIKPVNGSNFTVIAGTTDIDTTNAMHVVKFTPDVIPQGGSYIVKIEVSGEMVESSALLFGGAGTTTNPYLVSQVRDILAILDHEEYNNKHFLQTEDIISTLTEPIEINNLRKIEFSGTYDGANKLISFTGNGGLFHEIKESGIVKNLSIESSTNLYAAEANLYPIGAVADINAGLIENINSRALLENARLQGSLPVFTTVDTTDHTTGAGGIVGSNEATGIIREVTVGGAGAVKAGRGVGGVAAYNFGLIEKASVTATLPAGNQANSGNSSNTYSYGGGIAGFNFGTIQQSNVSGRVFAQSAYAEAGAGNEGKNIAFGGIAGYNQGLITDSSFARNMSVKEFIDKTRAGELGDAANNLGVASVHGDLYVGGIAGINAGQITSVYVGGALIGARDFAGGITGLTLGSGTISNSYVFAEVAIKDVGGVKITEANAKTTATTYEIAPSGFDANTTVLKRLVNSVTEATWVPGNLEAPMLPLFNASDLEKVGNKFAASGVLLWQSGAVTGVDIVLDNVVLPYGDSIQLEYTVSPSSAPDLYTTWSSDDESVVVVHGDGMIEGVGEGTATITVTTRDGGFTDTILVTVEDYVHVGTVTVTSPEMTLPVPNTITDRPEVEIDTVINFVVDILPADAQYKNYSLSSSNSRAVVDGNQVTFVYGNTGPGNVSITISFEDSSVTPLEYRFLTKQTVVPVDTPISSVSITSPEITLPDANNAEGRVDIEINTVINILVTDILPVDATNKNYTVTVSNSRGTVVGNEVTFITLGLISVYVTFEDQSIGDNGVFNYRFTIVAAPVDPVDIPISSVTITSPEITLPEVNNADVRQDIEINSVVNLVVEILPVDATNKNYTVTVSNSRGTVVGNEVTMITLGLISILVTFEDTTVGASGVFNFRFTIVAAPVDPVDIPISSVTVTSPEFTMPAVNNIDVRPEIEIGTVINLVVDILPVDATNKTYVVTTSNSRAEAVGNQISFVYGATGPGNVSVVLTFEDTTVGINGVLEYRFKTIAAPISYTASVTSPEITLGAANVITDKALVPIDTNITFVVTFAPSNPANMNYTLTTSNGRATVNLNQSITFNLSSSVGNVSVTFTFEDTSIPTLIYYFTTTNG